MLYNHLKKLIVDAQHILLLTDERIDGDTLGSTLGLYFALTSYGKKVSVFSPKPLPESLAFIPGVEHIGRDTGIFADKSVDLVMICDCSDGVYIKDFLPQLPQQPPLVVFDHHATNPRYGELNIVQSTAASTCDVVWSVLQTLHIPLTALAAQCLLTGLCTDTIAFSTRSTTGRAFSAASELLSHGANFQQIIDKTLHNQKLATLKVLGLAMSRLAYDKELQAMTTAITYQDLLDAQEDEDNWSAGRASEIINELSEEKPEHGVCIVYSEKSDGTIRGSIRSRGRDISKLATERWNGGGHKLAAGFSVKNGRLICENGVWKITDKV